MDRRPQRAAAKTGDTSRAAPPGPARTGQTVVPRTGKQVVSVRGYPLIDQQAVKHVTLLRSFG
jgi:hypothetical protein